MTVKKYFPYLVISCLFLSCENNLKEVQELNTKSTGVEVARHIETYYYGGNGKLKAKLTAPLLYRYMKSAPYMEINDGLRVDFYNDSLQLESVLTARKGYYNEGENDMWVKDSVVVINREGNRLDCEDLHWDPKNQEFFTKHFAKMTSATGITIGKDGLKANQDFSRIGFFNSHANFEIDSTLGAP